MKLLAQIFSWLFHPIYLPALACALVYWANPQTFSAYTEPELRQMILIIVSNTIFYPLITILMMRGLKLIRSLEMEDPQERILPFIATGVFYLWAYEVVVRTGYPRMLSTVLLGACITLFVTFFINLFRKVSIHTGSMGSLIVIALFIAVNINAEFTWLLMVVIVLAGIIGSSRMILNAHNTGEIFIGYFIGFMSQMIALRFY